MLKSILFTKVFALVILSLISFQSKSQCQLFVSADTVAYNSCRYAVEDVVWDNLVNTTATGNNIEKTAAGNSWNADATSLNMVYNNGFVQTIADETTTNRMIGLNDVNGTSSYTELEYAIYLRNNGEINIYENNVNLGRWGTYETGDTLRISIQNNRVYYIKNNYTMYKSDATPVLPLFVDISINTSTGTFKNVVVGNGIDSTFTAFESTPGAGPVYQWQLNGTNVGANSSTYTGGLSSNDSLTCILTPGTGGCDVVNDTSNLILIQEYPLDRNATVYIKNDSSLLNSCLFSIEDVKWETLSGLEENGLNSLVKISPRNSFTAGAFSFNQVLEGGNLKTIINETNTRRAIGLSQLNTDVDLGDIDFAFYLENNSTLRIYESGSNLGNFGSYATGDSLSITVVGNVVRYLKNGNVIYTSGVTPNLPLHVDVSMRDQNATLEDITITNTTYGRFFAAVDGLDNLTYQWKLNGLNVGMNSPSYFGDTLESGDSVWCQISIIAANFCGLDTSFNSNLIKIDDQNPKKNLIFAIRNDSIRNPSCKYAFEEVAWQSINGLSLSGTNNVTKAGIRNAWDAGAFSFNKVEEGGFMQTIASETNTNRMIGLNSVNTTVSYQDIDFAFYLQADGDVVIYESGVSKGNLGAYSTNDTLRISVVGNTVRYIQNGNVLYTSLVTPTLPLFVDMSLRTPGATLQEIAVSNSSYGRFTAFVDGVSDFEYKWRLNGVDVGISDSIYTNPSVVAGDTVSCDLILLNTVGCTADTVEFSNKIIISEESIVDNVIFSIRNDSVVNNSCNYAFEEVGWQNLSSLQLNGSNNLTRVGSSNSWDGGAFSFNKVEEGGFVQTIVNETNTNRMIGLNAVNVNTNYTDIDYAIYLRNNGTIQIYENGSFEGNWGGYSTGDTLQVSVLGNTVRYLKNGNAIYTSLVAPTLPLFVDLSINTIGGTLEKIFVNNATAGNYTAFVDGIDSVSYQWTLNGVAVGTDSSGYFNPNTNEGDTIACNLILNQTIGCAPDTIKASNRIIINKQLLIDNATISIRNDSVVETACNYAFEEVGFQSISGLSLSNRNSVVKVESTNGWNAGAFSFNKVEEGGFMQTIINETNTIRMFGLNAVNVSVNFNDIDYAFYLRNNGSIEIRENGANRGNWGAYSTGDTLRVAVVANTVRYIQNGNIIYTSLIAPTLPLFVDLSINTFGGTVENIVVNNATSGNYSSLVDGADEVSYQWRLNGIAVGIDSSGYFNPNTTAGDTISCDLSILNTVSCVPDTVKRSNRIIINQQSLADNVIFAIRNDSVATIACKYAFEEIGFQSLSSLQLSGTNKVTKVGSSSGWDAGAFSFNKIEEGGFAQTIVNETNTNRMFGLNSANQNVSFTDIDYAFFLRSNGIIRIYENGTNRGDWGGYSTGDTLQVSVLGNTVRYIQNGNVIYTSNIVPTLPLFVDLSISTVGGTFEQIVINNATAGLYSSFVDGIDSVQYNWKLNGLVVGNEATYLNPNAIAGDTISCDLILMNTIGCAPDTIKNSNRIIINEQKLIDRAIFSIRNDSVVNPSCKYAFEEAGFQSLSSVTLTGANNVTKASMSNGWNAGAFSYNKVEKSGFMQTIVNERNTNRMIGLNSVNQNVSYTDIDFAFYLQSNGNIRIYENGSNKGDWGAYFTGDTLQISVIGSTVRYIQNGSIIYTSLNVPTLPLFVDMSLRTPGATLEKIFVNNATFGIYSAFVDGVDSVAYQWKLNGVNEIGETNAIYTNTSAVAGDTISCDLMLTKTVGCVPDTIKGSNRIIINEQSLISSVLYSIRNDSLREFSCLFANEQVAWQSISSLDQNGTNNVTKVGSSDGWNAGAFSFNKVDQGGFMQTIVNERNTNRMVGLNASNTNVSYSDIDYAFYLRSNGNLGIYENGSNRGDFGVYNSGDTLRIAVIDNEIISFKNSSQLYKSTIAPVFPLFVDLSIRTVGGTLQKLTVYNGLNGIFAAFSDGATNVKYEWKLNGVVVGSDTSAYENLSLSDGDTLSSTLAIVGAVGCDGDTVVTSNTIFIEEVPFENFISFYIDRESTTTNGCQYALVNASWNFETGVATSGNSVTKTLANNNWNAGAFSINAVFNNGYLQFVVPQTDKNMMVGLNATNQGFSFNDIDYCFNFVNNGQLRIYENGANRGLFGTYATNDTFRIDAIGGAIMYYKNNQAIYTSAIAPTLPLYIDMSLNSIGSNINDFVIANATNGKYSAVTTNAGDNPIFQWKLNGLDVGSNSSTYANDTLTEADVISCVLTPDYGSCSVPTTSSNEISVINTLPEEVIPVFAPVTTNWNGSSADWYDESNWSNGVPHSGSRAVIPAAANYPTIFSNTNLYQLSIAAAASVTLDNNAYLTLYSDFDNQGTWSPGDAKVEVKLCQDEISTWSTNSQIQVDKLLLNNPKGLQLTSGNILVGDSLIFNQGIIFNNANAIIFADDAIAINSSDSTYIQGEIEKVGNDAFTFPTGLNDQLRPIAISAPADITSSFKARFYYQDPDDDGYDDTALDAGLDHVSSCEYWILDRTNAVSPVSVTLSWDTSSCGVTLLNDLRVARWDGSTWINHGNGGTLGSLSAGTISSSGTIGSFSPFTLGSSSAANPLPITLIDFRARLTNKIVELEWETAAEVNNDYFSLEKSTDLENWIVFTTQKGAGNSSTFKSYTDKDLSPFKGTSYYRLKQTDFNGDFEYSTPIAINYTENQVEVYPNPILNYINISNKDVESIVKVYTADGRIIYSGNQSRINTENWAKGAYELIIVGSSQVEEKRFRLIK